MRYALSTLRLEVWKHDRKGRKRERQQKGCSLKQTLAARRSAGFDPVGVEAYIVNGATSDPAPEEVS